MTKVEIIKRVTLYVFLLITATAGTIGATAAPGLKFEYLTLRDGLSQSSVNCITQDSTGFLWFGTQSGLNRYDGYEFVIFKHNPFDSNSISNDWVQVMVETEPGVLWLGTWTEGLNRFDTINKKITRFTHTPGNESGLLHNGIRAILKDSSGGLWIGTKGGLDYLSPGSNTFRHYTHNPADPASLSDPEITAIYENNRGTTWVGTMNGLNRLDRETGKFTRFFHNPDNPGSLSDNNITTIIGDFRGNLWVGTKSSGLNVMVPGKDRFDQFRHDPKEPGTLCSDSISSLLVDGNGCVWVGTGNIETHGNGLARLSFDENTGRWEVTNYEYRPHGMSATSLLSPYLSDRTILSIYEDRGGGLWFGSFQGGINKLNKRRAKFPHYSQDLDNPDSLNDNTILSFAEDGAGNLWVGTYSGGLNRFDRDKKRFFHYKYDLNVPDTIKNDSIWSIHPDSSGVLYLGTGGSGIIVFDPDREKFTPFTSIGADPFRKGSNTISSLLEDNAGRLWIGSWNAGLNLADRKTKKILHYPLDPDGGKTESVVYLYEDNGKNLWLCSYGKGLIKATASGGNGEKPVNLHFRSYTRKEGDAHSISSDYVNCILEPDTAEKRIMWIATGYGLNLFDMETETFTCFSEANGLCNNNVYGIVQSGEDLWLTTNGGLSRFNTRTLQFKNYDTGDGIQGMEFNQGAFLRSRNFEIFIGGINGFNAFFPVSVPRNPNIPPVVITRVNTFDKEISFPRAVHTMDSVELTYRDRFFSFEFAALDYENPGKNRYAYKLEGFNDDWIQCGNRRYVSFSNLTGGEFVFRVKGSNNDGIWNEDGAMMHISIKPSFFSTWWFRSGLILLFILTFLAILLSRTRHLKQKMENKNLESQLKLKTDFTAMLVHDLRSPLQCIIGYTDIMEDEKDINSTHYYSERIKKSSNTMLQLINDMLDISKFEAGKMVINTEQTSLCNMVEDNIRLLEPLLAQKGIRFEKRLDSLPSIQVDPVRISQVINNLLSNALKFSPKGGVIRVTVQKVEYDDTEFHEVSIADEGAGIPPEKQSSLFTQYTQLKSKSEIPAKGTGLGLAVSRHIIEAHHGMIGFRKSVPHGSIFYFRLPANMEKPVN